MERIDHREQYEPPPPYTINDESNRGNYTQIAQTTQPILHQVAGNIAFVRTTPLTVGRDPPTGIRLIAISLDFCLNRISFLIAMFKVIDMKVIGTLASTCVDIAR